MPCLPVLGRTPLTYASYEAKFGTSRIMAGAITADKLAAGAIVTTSSRIAASAGVPPPPPPPFVPSLRRRLQCSAVVYAGLCGDCCAATAPTDLDDRWGWVEVSVLGEELRYIRGRCRHRDVVPVDLLTGEIVAQLCLTCDLQLPPPSPVNVQKRYGC